MTLTEIVSTAITQAVEEARPTIQRIDKDAAAIRRKTRKPKVTVEEAANALASPQVCIAGRREARYTIRTFYTIQKQRIRAENQTRALTELGEPCVAVAALANYYRVVEDAAKKWLDDFGKVDPVAKWARTIYGVGPIIATGLAAHIDPARMPNYGALWTYAGLAKAKWLGNEKGKELIHTIRKAHKGTKPSIGACAMLCQTVHRSPEALAYYLTRKHTANHSHAYATIEEHKPTWKQLTDWAILCPHNQDLKVLCWKIGESFVKHSADDKSFYGKIYRRFYELEWERNYGGLLVDEADRKMREAPVADTTDAYSWYSGSIKPQDAREYMALDDAGRAERLPQIVGKPGDGVKMLPPSHIYSRAKRIAVKEFLVHYFEESWRIVKGTEPPVRYTHKDLGYAIGAPPSNPPRFEYDPDKEAGE